jgi:hypothetical protein
VANRLASSATRERIVMRYLVCRLGRTYGEWNESSSVVGGARRVNVGLVTNCSCPVVTDVPLLKRIEMQQATQIRYLPFRGVDKPRMDGRRSESSILCRASDEYFALGAPRVPLPPSLL